MTCNRPNYERAGVDAEALAIASGEQWIVFEAARPWDAVVVYETKRK